jgi:hypothetical protein
LAIVILRSPPRRHKEGGRMGGTATYFNLDFVFDFDFDFDFCFSFHSQNPVSRERLSTVLLLPQVTVQSRVGAV